MNEWLTDKEKRLLFSALTREKKVCEDVDKESCREPYEESLVSIVESLEHKFYYDRLFKQIRTDAINEFLKELFCMRNFNDWNAICKIAEQLKGGAEE